MSSTTDKLSQFQAITGLQETDLCTEILSAHNWNLDEAISTITSTSSDPDQIATTETTAADSFDQQLGLITTDRAAPPGLAWKLITLPISVISGSPGLFSGAVWLGLGIVGGVLSYSLSLIGLTNLNGASASLVSVSTAATEAMEFVNEFESEYEEWHSRLLNEGFTDVLQRWWQTPLPEKKCYGAAEEKE